MRTKSSFKVPSFTIVPALALVAGTGFLACAAELQSGCPEGTVQTAGGGDVSDACTPAGQLPGPGGAAGGEVGGGAGAGQAGAE